jgi:hypothetical protein
MGPCASQHTRWPMSSGNLVGAPTLDAGDVKLRKPAVGHVAMIAAQSHIGYAGASNAVT